MSTTNVAARPVPQGLSLRVLQNLQLRARRGVATASAVHDLAPSLGADPRHVKAALRRLVLDGWIMIEWRPGVANRHHLLDDAECPICGSRLA